MVAEVGWPIALLTMVGLGVYFGPHAGKVCAVHRLRRACRASRSLVLTYDDGPGAELTPRVLGLLQEHRARATFFLLGMRAVQNPNVVQQVAAAGHEIGCHSHRHFHAWTSWPWQAVRDIERGYRALSPWIHPGALFRPPCGQHTVATWAAVRRRRATTGWWTVDAGDTHMRLPPPELAVEAVRRNEGGVVLLHDFDRDLQTRAERSQHVLTTTRLLLELARARGLAVRPLGELLAAAQ